MSNKYTNVPLRESILGEALTIKRALPSRYKRTIGAWCFLDHLGPVDVVNGRGGINVNPHPHIGLQTFTWMISGQIEHRDSLGNHNIVLPNEVNLMTAGKGIVHTEDTPTHATEILQAIQLWIALPQHLAKMVPTFQHYKEIPSLSFENLQISVLVGEFMGKKSNVKVYSPLVALDIQNTNEKGVALPLNADFEYGVLVIKGSLTTNKMRVDQNTFLVMERGEKELTLRIQANTHFVLLGGKPLDEELVIWWNFVGYTQENIEKARDEWENNHSRFGEVEGHLGARMVAPPLSARLRGSR